MQPKGKNIHKVLEYICSKKEQENFVSGEIAENTNLSLGEVNEIFRFLIDNEELHDSSTSDTPERNEEILLADSAYDAYETRKYLRNKPAFLKFIMKFWWAILLPIIIGIILLFIEYECFK